MEHTHLRSTRNQTQAPTLIRTLTPHLITHSSPYTLYPQFSPSSAPPTLFSGILAHAVGIAPSKDNYWSTQVQNGTHYGPKTREGHPTLQSIALTFTNGPVAPSDRVGGSNPALIKRACMDNGTLLAPDRPMTYVDAVLVARAFGKVGACTC